MRAFLNVCLGTFYRSFVEGLFCCVGLQFYASSRDPGGSLVVHFAFKHFLKEKVASWVLHTFKALWFDFRGLVFPARLKQSFGKSVGFSI